MPTTAFTCRTDKATTTSVFFAHCPLQLMIEAVIWIINAKRKSAGEEYFKIMNNFIGNWHNHLGDFPELAEM